MEHRREMQPLLHVLADNEMLLGAAARVPAASPGEMQKGPGWGQVAPASSLLHDVTC